VGGINLFFDSVLSSGNVSVEVAVVCAQGLQTSWAEMVTVLPLLLFDCFQHGEVVNRRKDKRNACKDTLSEGEKK